MRAWLLAIVIGVVLGLGVVAVAYVVDVTTAHTIGRQLEKTR